MVIHGKLHNMRILGIDPGYERLGVAVLEKNIGDKKERVIFSECFKTPTKIDFALRLEMLGGEIKKTIKKYKPDVISIETLFFEKNQKTAMRVAEARGVVIYEAICAKLEIFEATPLQIKMATTGYGKADKQQIIKMVKMLVEIPDNKTSDDELDAIAIALSAFAYLRQNRLQKNN